MKNVIEIASREMYNGFREQGYTDDVARQLVILKLHKEAKNISFISGR